MKKRIRVRRLIMAASSSNPANQNQAIDDQEMSLVDDLKDTNMEIESLKLGLEQCEMKKRALEHKNRTLFQRLRGISDKNQCCRSSFYTQNLCRRKTICQAVSYGDVIFKSGQPKPIYQRWIEFLICGLCIEFFKHEIELFKLILEQCEKKKRDLERLMRLLNKMKRNCKRLKRLSDKMKNNRKKFRMLQRDGRLMQSKST